MKCSDYAMNELLNGSEKNGVNQGKLSPKLSKAIQEYTKKERIRNAVIENLEAMVGIFNSEKKLEDFNTEFSLAYKLFTGKKLKAGDLIYDYLPCIEKKILQSKIQKAFAGQKIVFEKVFILKKEKKYYRITLNPVINNGLVTEIIAFALDISATKLAEENLEAEKRLSDAIIGSLPDIFYLQDQSGNYLRWNKNFEKVSGYSSKEIPTLKPINFYEPAERARIRAAVEKVFKEGYAELETEIITKSGKRIPYYLNGISVCYEGKPCLLGSGIDLSVRKAAQKASWKSEEKYQSIFDQALDGIMIADLKGDIVDVNDSMCRIFGYKRKELLQMNIADLYDSEYLKSDPLRFDLLKEGKTIERARLMLHKDRRTIEVEYNVRKISNEQTITFYRDVTELRKAQKQIQLNEQLFRDAYERLHYHINNTPLAVVERDKDLKITKWNKRAEEMYGWKAKEVLGKRTIDFLVHEEEKEKAKMVLANLQKGIINKKPGENRYYKKDGSIVYSQWYHSLLKDKNGNVEAILSMINDITERKTVEFELREAELKFRSLVEKSLVGVYIIQNGKFAYVNPEFANILGYRQEELIDTYSVEKVVLEEDRAMVSENLRARLDGEKESVHYEVRGRKKDGTRIWTEVFGSRTVYKGNPAIIGTLLNITQRKLTEQKLRLTLEQLTDQKVQEQKKISRAIIKAQEKERNKIGQELHDNVNQLLASTRIYMNMVRKSVLVKKDLVNQAIEFTDKAIQEIRSLSKEHVTPVKNINLQELIQSLADQLRESTGLNISFECKLPELFKADNDLKLNIYRVIQEQLNNIHKHASAKVVKILMELKEKYIDISVKDDGKGFDISKKKKGVGISNITNRVESYNGTVAINSHAGAGCEMNIRIPLFFTR